MEKQKTGALCNIFNNQLILKIEFGAIGAALHYGSGSTKMMRLLAASALQHWEKHRQNSYFKMFRPFSETDFYQCAGANHIDRESPFEGILPVPVLRPEFQSVLVIHSLGKIVPLAYFPNNKTVFRYDLRKKRNERSYRTDIPAPV
jgi:hypothetical protein